MVRDSGSEIKKKRKKEKAYEWERLSNFLKIFFSCLTWPPYLVRRVVWISKSRMLVILNCIYNSNVIRETLIIPLCFFLFMVLSFFFPPEGKDKVGPEISHVLLEVYFKRNHEQNKTAWALLISCLLPLDSQLLPCLNDCHFYTTWCRGTRNMNLSHFFLKSIFGLGFAMRQGRKNISQPGAIWCKNAFVLFAWFLKIYWQCTNFPDCSWNPAQGDRT